MHARNRISMISVDELEKGTGSLSKPSEGGRSRRRGDFTTMDWIQFVILVLILLALTTILIIIIIIIVKLQSFSKSADNCKFPFFLPSLHRGEKGTHFWPRSV